MSVLEGIIKSVFEKGAKLVLPKTVKRYGSMDEFFQNATYFQKRMILVATNAEKRRATMRFDSEKVFKKRAEEAKELMCTEIATDKYMIWVASDVEIDLQEKTITIYVSRWLHCPEKGEENERT